MNTSVFRPNPLDIYEISPRRAWTFLAIVGAIFLWVNPQPDLFVPFALFLIEIGYSAIRLVRDKISVSDDEITVTNGLNQMKIPLQGEISLENGIGNIYAKGANITYKTPCIKFTTKGKETAVNTPYGNHYLLPFVNLMKSKTKIVFV